MFYTVSTKLREQLDGKSLFYPITKEIFNWYSIYKRRSDRKSFLTKVNDQLLEMTNKWIVPYNPYLSTHINVEVYSTIKTVKCFHKYICKVYDSANFKTANFRSDGRIDYYEISLFLNMCYVSALVACTRFLEFPIQAKSHGVQETVVNLLYHQSVCIPDANIEAILKQ